MSRCMANIRELNRDDNDRVPPRRPSPEGSARKGGTPLYSRRSSVGPRLAGHQVLGDPLHGGDLGRGSGTRTRGDDQERDGDEEANDKKGEGLASEGHGAFL